LTKTAAPVTKFAPSWWIDYAQQWARDSGVQGVIRSLLPAIIASGDVQYSFDDRSAFWLDPYRASGRVVDAQGHVWEFGLTPPHYGGKPASPDAWRKVLDTGNALLPSAPARRMAPPSPARVIVGGW
jgi:hypothetical protein